VVGRLRSGIVTTTLSAAGIAALTLHPAAPDLTAPPASPLCVLCGSSGTTDFVLNLLLFAPLGAGLWLLGLRAPAAVAAGAALSLGIELAQGLVLSSRHAALGDLLANSAGTWVGFLTMSRLVPPWPVPSRGQCLLRCVTTWAVAVAAPILAAIAFQPLAPGGGSALYGQWANVFGNTARFEGRVLKVYLNGEPLPEGLVTTDSRPVVWSDRTRKFEARVVTGQLPGRRALVAAVADGRGRQPVAIWQDGVDATLSLQLRATRLGVRSPDVRIPRAFAVPEGTDLDLGIELRQGTLTATAVHGNGQAGTHLPLRASASWILMWPWGSSFDREPRWRTGLWLLVWGATAGLLLGYWGTLARAGGSAVVAALAIAPITHAGIPSLAGLPWGSPVEWAVTVVSIALGLAAGRPLARGRRIADAR
jgi:hypothetical protein